MCLPSTVRRVDAGVLATAGWSPDILAGAGAVTFRARASATLRRRLWLVCVGQLAALEALQVECITLAKVGERDALAILVPGNARDHAGSAGALRSATLGQAGCRQQERQGQGQAERMQGMLRVQGGLHHGFRGGLLLIARA